MDAASSSLISSILCDFLLLEHTFFSLSSDITLTPLPS